jgi:hypothetical protein
MAEVNLVEIHVQGLPEVAVKAADDLMNAAHANGYVVRVSESIETIKQGDGSFAIDYGDRDRALAEAEIKQWIDGINGGDALSIVGDFGDQNSN